MTRAKKEKVTLGPAPAGAVAIVFKHEDANRSGMPLGPAWFRLADKSLVNVLDTGRTDFTGKTTPTWFPLEQMRGYAKHLGLPLEEV